MLDAVSSVLLDVSHVSQSFLKGSGEMGPPVLQDVSLTLKEGEIVGLIGRSGCGKSTLLRIISGLTRQTAGDVSFCGQPVTGPYDGTAMVFQSFALFPWLNVLDNVEIGLRAHGTPPEESRKQAIAAIDVIGLDGFELAYPKELSGGMRQRVGFARALVVQPKMLLMDEPFSALDVLTAETLRTDLLDLWSEGRMPTKSILMVTHNIEEAVLMCDRILVLSSNPGRIAAEIQVSLIHPRNRLDPEFRQLVDKIYALMTQRPEPKPAGREGGVPGMGLGMELPSVSTNSLAGLLEELAAPPYNGRADLPHLAELAATRDRRPLSIGRDPAIAALRRIRRGRHQADSGRQALRRYGCRSTQEAVRRPPARLCAARRAHQTRSRRAAASAIMRRQHVFARNWKTICPKIMRSGLYAP